MPAAHETAYPRLKETGYGNDSRQNGPLSSQILHICLAVEFAFYVETRPRRLTRRRATDPLIAHEAGFFSVFCDVPVSGLVSAKANRGRVCRPIANPTPVLSRVGEMRIGSALVLRRERNRCLTRLCRVRCSGTNGPFCRESLPYPRSRRPIMRLIWRIQMWS